MLDGSDYGRLGMVVRDEVLDFFGRFACINAVAALIDVAQVIGGHITPLTVRAFVFSPRITHAIGDVAAPGAEARLREAVNAGGAETIALRKEPWTLQEIEDEEDRPKDKAREVQLSQDAELPPELLDRSQERHDQTEIASLIREGLWRRAGWSGVVFITPVDRLFLPVFGLIFSDAEPAREIFKHWRDEIGEIDREERLRVAVVRGIDRERPRAYRVIIGSEPTSYPFRTPFVNFVHRVHTMSADTPINLDRFLRARDAVDAFFLAPAFMGGGLEGPGVPDPDMELRIAVHRVRVRHAWEVGLHDVDRIAIKEGDDPVIPEGVEDAPVWRLLEKRRSV